MTRYRCATCEQAIRLTRAGWVHVSSRAKVNNHKVIPLIAVNQE